MRFSRVGTAALAIITAGLLSTSALAHRPQDPLPKPSRPDVDPAKPPYQAPRTAHPARGRLSPTLSRAPVFRTRRCC